MEEVRYTKSGARIISREEYKNLYSDFNTWDKSKLMAEVKRYAKVANTRMYSLEKAGYQETSYAYRKNVDLAETREDIMRHDYKGNPRYRTDVSNMSFQQLKSEFAMLRGFVFEANTSTPSGVRETIQKRVDTYNKDKENKITSEQFSEIFEMKNIESAIRRYGSEVIVKIRDGLADDLHIDEIDEMLKEQENNVKSFRQLEREIQNAVEKRREQTTKEQENNTPFGAFQSI